MSFTVQSIYNYMPTLLAGRTVQLADAAEACRKTVLELTEDYKFPQLQTAGPTVQLTPFQQNYSINYFLSVSDQVEPVLEINKVSSFFMYTNPNLPPTVGVANNQSYNAGYNLIFKTADALQILMNQQTLPTNWTRFNDQIYIAATPDLAYYIYMWYQKEHPFPNAGLITAGNDPILMPNSWQDIVEYGTAMRLANEVRLYDIANQFRTNIYGDPLFQRSGGTEGTPGLIFHRTSQEQRDQTTSTKSMRLMIRPYQK